MASGLYLGVAPVARQVTAGQARHLWPAVAGRAYVPRRLTRCAGRLRAYVPRRGHGRPRVATVVGWLSTGQPVATFRIASTPRVRDNATNEWKDGDSLFLSCNVWRQAAENVAESLQRGMRVIATGRLKQRNYETREGEKRTVYEVEVEVEVEVDDVGPSLQNASAKVNRASRGSGEGREPDPWASGNSGSTDEPSF